MSYFYFIFGIVAAISIPHLTNSSVDTVTNIMLQMLFLLVGIWGAFTFWQHD